jgi:hypothetical protein
MCLLSKKLTALAVSYQLFYIFQSYRPVVLGSESFANQGPRGYVIAIAPGVNFFQDLSPFLMCKAFEENVR